MKKVNIKNGSRNYNIFVDDNWKAGDFDEVTVLENFDITSLEVKSFVEKNGEVVKEQRKWGWAHFLEIEGQKFSMGFTDYTGKISEASSESSDGMRRASQGVNTVNFEKTIDVCIYENIEALINMALSN
jgi:hypothetical protein